MLGEERKTGTEISRGTREVKEDGTVKRGRTGIEKRQQEDGTVKSGRTETTGIEKKETAGMEDNLY